MQPEGDAVLELPTSWMACTDLDLLICCAALRCTEISPASFNLPPLPPAGS